MCYLVALKKKTTIKLKSKACVLLKMFIYAIKE